MSRIVLQHLSDPLPDTLAGQCQFYAKTDGRLWLKNGTQPELPVSSITDLVLQNDILNLAFRQAHAHDVPVLDLETSRVDNYSALDGLNTSASGTSYSQGVGYIESSPTDDLVVYSTPLVTPQNSYLCTLALFAETTGVSTVALNDEIKGGLSRDGGNTFVDLVLEEKGRWGVGDKKIFLARDVSVGFSTSLRYRITVDADTSYKVYGAAMSYRDNG